MCRVAGVTKITDKNRNEVWMFMMMLGELMTPGNTDGLGYAAFDKKGNLFGERWLHNKHAFLDISTHIPNLTAEKMAKIYSYFGDKVLKDEAQAMILHTRAATCGRGIENTHPFLNNVEKPQTAIIHNGMISNHNQLEKKFSTCDSEVIVHLYDKYGARNDLAKIDEVVGRMWGWYTVLALSTDEKGRMVMDAFTDAPRLSSFFIPDLDTRVYSTSAYDIQKCAEIFGMAIKDGKAMKANTAQRIDVLTGEVIERRKIGRMLVNPMNNSRVTTGGEVIIMEGDFNDEAFVKAFFDRK